MTGSQATFFQTSGWKKVRYVLSAHVQNLTMFPFINLLARERLLPLQAEPGTSVLWRRETIIMTNVYRFLMHGTIPRPTKEPEECLALKQRAEHAKCLSKGQRSEKASMIYWIFKYYAFQKGARGRVLA